MNNSNNTWLTENPLYKNKKRRYHYDFGTGIEVERDEVKKERDAFLEGLNFNEPTKETNSPHKTEPTTKFPFEPSYEVKIEKSPSIPNKPVSMVQYPKQKSNFSWGSSLGGDLKSSEDIKLFLEGVAEESEQLQNKPQNQDAIEFGENSETYKILQDLSKRWYDTSDSAERDRLHKVAEEVRRLTRGNNPLKYGTDEIFDVMHENAKTGQLTRRDLLRKIPIKSAFMGHPLATISGNLLEPSVFLTAMADNGPWDYKLDEHWRVGGKDGGDLSYFDGKKLDDDNNRNWLPWIYFDGYLIGADKFGNMNMAYVGKKMGLPEWVYKNPTTMDDPEDIFWIDKGINYANSGR